MTEKATTVLLRFTGSPVVRRVIGDLEWSAANGHVNVVPIELAADLFTSRESGEWALAEKPKPVVLKQLAELMGAPPDLIQISDKENEVIDNG